jgi:V8-like Glu-specific endopeptidase
MRFDWWLCVVAMGLALGCSSSDIASDEGELIHGSDDRQDVYAHPDERLRNLAAQSIVALVPSDRIDASKPNDITFDVGTLAEERDLCGDERFANDPAIAHCSGTLIADNLVLTSAHCISGLSCEHLSLVFGVYRDAADTLHKVTKDDVFGCKGVQSIGSVPSYDALRDVVVLELDRRATRFEPVRVAPSEGSLAAGTPLATIGFPWGAPAKIESRGAVTDPRADKLDYFLTNQDILRGNSGSGVFHRDTLELVGVVTGFSKVAEETTPQGNCGDYTNVAEGRGTTHVAYARHVPGFGSCPGPGDVANYGFDVGGMLPQMSACSETATKIPAVISVPGELAWRFAPIENIGSCGGTLRLAPSSPKLSFCAYTQCYGGASATRLTCSGSTAAAPGGQPGCCNVGGGALDMQVTCSSGGDGMFLHLLTLPSNMGTSCSKQHIALSF